MLVRLLNAELDHASRYHARQRELGAALVRYAQRVEPVVDARDDMRVARTPTETAQVLEVFARRIEAMGERLSGLLALRDRTDALSEELRALREGLAAEPPPPETARAAARSAADSAYTAFENRFRGSREEVARRQADYVERLRGHAPVVDLGCGRGELLELLRDYEALDQDEKTINVHVSHLRDKIEDDPAAPAFVLTVRGVGYAFAER